MPPWSVRGQWAGLSRRPFPVTDRMTWTGTMLPQMTSTTTVPVPWYALYAASGPGRRSGPQSRATVRGPIRGLHRSLQRHVHELGHQRKDSSGCHSCLYDHHRPDDPGGAAATYGAVFQLLLANDGWAKWVPTVAPLVLIHCPTDDVVLVGDRTAAIDALTGKALITKIDVQPVALIEPLLGSIHTAAYPTAMLAAFTAIHTIDLTTP